MNTLSLEIRASTLSPLVTVFMLRGHLDAVTVTQVESKFRELMASSSYRWVIELSRLEYISSAGLGSFIGVLEEIRSHGGDILFVGLSPKLQKIFQILGFTRIFKIFADEAEAVRAFDGMK